MRRSGGTLDISMGFLRSFLPGHYGEGNQATVGVLRRPFQELVFLRKILAYYANLVRM